MLSISRYIGRDFEDENSSLEISTFTVPEPEPEPGITTIWLTK